MLDYRKTYIILGLALLPYKSANGLLGFLGDTAKKSTEAVAYADAVAELLEEVSPDSSVTDGANHLEDRLRSFRKTATTYHSVGRETKAVLQGPNWADVRLDHNIRRTTQYIRRLKRLISKITALGTQGVVALNTTQTNRNLNEIQKNQQALILLEREKRVQEMIEREKRRESWEKFIREERRKRKTNS